MSTSTTKTVMKPVPEPLAARCDDANLIVELADGRTITAPLVWFPRLFHGTAAERAHAEIGISGIHWPALNEDISIEGLLNGERSGESPRSIQRWLELRAKGQKEPIPHLPLPA